MAQGRQLSKFDSFLEDKYIPLEKKKKLIFAALLLLLPAGLFVFLLFMPANNKIKALKTQIAQLEQEVAKAKKAAASLPQHQADLDKAKELFESLSVMLPKQKEIPDLLRNISDLGRRAGLDFLSFKPGSEVPKDFYSEIPLDITVRGPYHNLGSFLDQVSKLPRIVTVNNIKMGGPKQDGEEMLLDSTFQLLTYRFTNVAQAPPPDQAGKKSPPKQTVPAKK